MLLYHGTSERVARLALKEGLSPRNELDEDGNWEEHPSCGAMVYLTTAYAGFFALNATKEGERWGIIEIDSDRLDEDNLRPDEDFLEQASRSEENRKAFHAMGLEHDPEDVLAMDASMAERTRWIRDHIEFFGPWWGNGDFWKKSIDGIGNCAHFGWIPVEAITRVGLFDPESNGTIAMVGLDPSISLMNFAICEGKYRAHTQWLVGDEIDPGALLGATWTKEAVADNPHVADSMQPHIERMREALAFRDGLEVIRAVR